MPLDSIVLDIAKLQLGDPLEFEFVENPSTKSIADAVTKMISLGCLGDDYSITNLGKVISALPVDATLGKMLVLGSISQLLGPILSMTGVLSIQSPFTRIPHGVTNVMENRKSLTSTHGDAFTLINLFMEWLEVKAENKVFND